MARVGLTCEPSASYFLKSTTGGLERDRGVSAPRCARGRGLPAGAAGLLEQGKWEARTRVSHLGRVTEQAESEAAAFELHLQGRAPGHGDPAPVVSREHAGGSAPLPVLCASRTACLCLGSFSLSLDAGPPVRPGISRCRVPKLRPRRRHLGGLGAAPSSSTLPKAGPAGPVPRRRASLARQPHSQDTLLLFASTAGAHHPFRSGSCVPHLSRGEEDQEAPPLHGSHLASRENSVAARTSAWRSAWALSPHPISPLSSLPNDHFNVPQSSTAL